MTAAQSDNSKQEIYRPEYSPAPKVEKRIFDRIDRIGGFTLSNRPRVRAVWGMDARGFPWPDPQEIKYASPNDPLVGWACWIVETYVEPSFFGEPEDWERNRYVWTERGQVAVMAPYPTRGEYVMVQPLATPAGEPFPLNDQACDYIEWLIKEQHERPHNGYTQQQAIKDRLAKIRVMRDQKRKAVDAQLEIHYDEHATRADDVNTAATRVYSFDKTEPETPRISIVQTIPADLRARASNFLKGAPKK